MSKNHNYSKDGYITLHRGQKTLQKKPYHLTILCDILVFNVKGERHSLHIGTAKFTALAWDYIGR